MNRFLLALPQHIKSNGYIVSLLIFMAILGSHLFDDKVYILVLLSLFLIDWRSLEYKMLLLPGAFLLSVAVTWISIDHRVLSEFEFGLNVISRLSLIAALYLMGLSVVAYIEREKKTDNIHMWFYILSIFIFAYVVILFISYFALKQDTPLSSWGMHVLFPNEYKRLNVNSGRLISTIIAYYLTVAIAFFVFVLTFLDKLKKRAFYWWEITLIIIIGLGALYFASVMDRRAPFVILLLAIVVVILARVREILYSKKNLAVALIILAAIVLSVYMFSGSVESNGGISRLLNSNLFDDKRFSWWGIGLKAMIDFPVGGGHGVMVAHHTKLAHNTWIDIGKDFGVLPFLLFLLLTLQYVYFLYKIVFFSGLDILIRILLVMVPLSIFPILMIEPVFTSDKTFIAYLFFHIGIVSKIYYERFTK